MPQYPQQSFQAMRQDAIRRSREMQKKAAALPPEEPPHPENNLPAELRSLLTDWDAERLALLALLYFLYKEGADLKLLLAIGYIML